MAGNSRISREWKFGFRPWSRTHFPVVLQECLDSAAGTSPLEGSAASWQNPSHVGDLGCYVEPGIVLSAGQQMFGASIGIVELAQSPGQQMADPKSRVDDLADPRTCCSGSECHGRSWLLIRPCCCLRWPDSRGLVGQAPPRPAGAEPKGSAGLGSRPKEGELSVSNPIDRTKGHQASLGRLLQ